MGVKPALAIISILQDIVKCVVSTPFQEDQVLVFDAAVDFWERAFCEEVAHLFLYGQDVMGRSPGEWRENLFLNDYLRTIREGQLPDR